MQLVKATDLEDVKVYIVRLGETDDEEPVLLYRVPLENGGDRCVGTPTTGRTWEYLGVN